MKVSLPLAVLTALSALFILVSPPVIADAPTAITYVVQPGDTLTRIALRYGVTVDELVAWNGIADPNLILVGQVLKIYVTAGATTTPSAVANAPLSFTWAVSDWRPADPNYVATIVVHAQGGQPPYTYYHDGQKQAANTFEVVWRRCRPKPGSIAVADAGGARISTPYWLQAPYCPCGVEIVEPAEGAHLKHMPRHFNVVWQPTVDPPPARYGMEIEVWQNGAWQPWQEYTDFDGTLFFVPDEFPGDLAGRVRMWGLYEGRFAGPKTPWRYFEFRVTY